MKPALPIWRGLRNGIPYRIVGGATVLVLLGAVTAALLNNTNESPPTPRRSWTAVGAQPPILSTTRARPNQSMIVKVRIGAPALRVPTAAAYVYLPPGYDSLANAGRRYPVIYLLHGYPGRPANWMSAGGVPDVMNELIGTRQIGPTIVVAPNDFGGRPHDSECLNQFDGPRIADYLVGPVVRYIDSHFRTIADRRGRAIGGLSSGGYCGLNLGLRHQDEFSVMVTFEPYGDPGRSVVRPLLGGSTRAYVANSPEYYLAALHIRQPLAAFLDVGGTFVRDIRRVETLARELRARGVIVQFRVEPGQHHTWKEAAVGLPFGILFAAHHLQNGMRTMHFSHRYSTVGLPPRSALSASVKAYAPLAARCHRLFGTDSVPAGATFSDQCVPMRSFANGAIG